jgi:hypothetical protein
MLMKILGNDQACESDRCLAAELIGDNDCTPDWKVFWGDVAAL